MKRKYKVFYFSGTHWDREWYQTFQEFRMRLVRALDDLIGYMAVSYTHLPLWEPSSIKTWPPIR